MEKRFLEFREGSITSRCSRNEPTLHFLLGDQENRCTCKTKKFLLGSFGCRTIYFVTFVLYPFL